MASSPIPSRKNVIFKEAARLFREKGYRASTLRELARRAGVQGGSIYHHFASKQDILYMIMEFTMTNLLTKLRQEVATETNPLEQLKKAIIFHIVYHTVDTDETFVTDSELRSLELANYKEIVSMRRAYENIFRNIMKNGNSQGCMAIEDIPLASKALLQLCTGISCWFTPDGKMSITNIAEKYVELICWGVCGKASPLPENTTVVNP